MRAKGPVVDPLPCSGCGKLLDPLRAGHVAIFDNQLHYFCDSGACREAFLTQFAESAGAPRVTPSPVNRVTPSPTNRVTPSPANRVTPSPSNRVTPSPSNRVTPAPPPRVKDRPSKSSAPGVDPGSTSGRSFPRTHAGLEDSSSRAKSDEPRSAAQSHAPPVANAHSPRIPEDVLPDPLRLDDDPALAEPVDRGIASYDPPRSDLAEPRDAGALLLLLGVVAGTLAVLLGLSATGRLVMLSRVLLAAVGVSVLVARALTAPRVAAEPNPLPLLAGPVAAVAVAAWSVIRADAALAKESVTLAGLIVTVGAVTAWMLEVARRPVETERMWIESVLDVPGRRLVGGAIEEGVLDLRPGERVQVEQGEDVPVDLVVSESEAEVLPWVGAASSVRRRVGDPVVAGAHVLRGRLIGTCTWAGVDRVFARLVIDPRRRIDVLDPVARAARSLVERWTALASLGAALLAFAISRSWLDAAMTAVAVQAGLATSVIASLPGTHVARGLMLTQRRGVTYKSADAWDRAAKASVAVFCARGTLLLGEPEVAEIEPISPLIDNLEVLALAAGAARAETTPTAQAILRAAKTRDVKPDAVRNPNVMTGLGVVAVSSAGEELCVGSRAHLLEQRIGITAAEWRIGELAALGRSIVLVALGGRVVGLIALSDGIRPGARAAVQHLLDAQLEPVLMSGDSRETCEAIARSLDVEHLRADVLPQDRGEEVKRIAESGESVAVFGHTPLDDVALGAANVSIALGAAGAASAEHDIALASDDLRDGALALVVARRTRVEARVGFGLAAIPPALGVLIVAVGLLPPAFVPIASLLGAVVAVLHIRGTARTRPEPQPAE